MKNNHSLSLASWFSPGVPIAAFDQSVSLTSILKSGEIKDAGTVSAWIDAHLSNGIGKLDVLFLSAAFDARSDDVLNTLHNLCDAHARQSGRDVAAKLVSQAFHDDMEACGWKSVMELSLPVAIGQGASLSRMPLDMTVRFYLYAISANLLDIAGRQIALSQIERQRIMRDQNDTIADISRNVPHGGIDLIEAELCKVSTLSVALPVRQHGSFAKL